MTVKFVKLITGDELITQCEDKGDSVVLTKAAKISVNFGFGDPPPMPQTRVDVFSPHTHGLRFTVSKQHVLCVEEPHASLRDYYNSTFLPGLPKD